MQVYKAKNSKLVRLSDFHPVHQVEGFFYMYLLKRYAFQAESELASAGNPDGTYFSECILRGHINDDTVSCLHFLLYYLGSK